MTAPLPHLRLVPADEISDPQTAEPGPAEDNIWGRNALARKVDFAPLLQERAGISPKLRRARQRSRHYARKALAKSTRDNYSYHWNRFVDWCDDMGVVALPADPDDVAAHLCDLADGELDDQERLVVDADGQVVRPPLAAATIDLRAAAINKAHETRGFAKPSKDTGCSETLKGIRHDLGVRARRRRDPLTLQLLRQVLEHMAAGTPGCAVRDLPLALLANHPRIGPTVLARLTWDRLRFSEEAVAVALSDAKVVLPGLVVTLRSRPDRPELCPVRALQGLRALTGGSGPVFPRLGPSGTPAGASLTDVAVHKALVRAARGAGASPLAAGRRWSDDELAAIARRLDGRRLLEVRDHALMLTGFVGAVRRSNLAAFRWDDFNLRAGEGLVVLLRRSKTDQAGAGFEVFLPYGANPLTCPVRAWEAWRDRMSEILGGDPQDVAADQPCFVPLGRGDSPSSYPDGRLRAMSDEAVNAVVRRRARAAGLKGNYGAHSLRAGFVTTLAELGVPIQKIAEQTGHKSLEVLRAYIRPIEGRRTSPALWLRQAEEPEAPEAPRRSGVPRRRYAGSQLRAGASAGGSSAGK